MSAVLISAIAGYAVGAVWYTLLFQKRWMALTGVEPGKTPAKFTAAQSMVLEFITTLVCAYILAHFAVLTGVASLPDALALGFWLWLGFQATILASTVWFENRPWELYCINASHRLVALLVMASVFGLWR